MSKMYNSTDEVTRLSSIRFSSKLRWLRGESVQHMSIADQALVSKAVDQEITHRVDLEPVADMLSEIDTALSSLKDVSERLQELHDSSCDGRTVSTQQNLDNSSHSALGCALSEIAVEIQHYRGQISYLSERIRRVGQLITDLLELSDSRSMRTLAEQAHHQTENMGKLTAKATRDAAAVKVLTVVTLVYLPATAVLNFFSTDFVTTERRDNGSLALIVTGNWWIILAAAVPLTIATVYIWQMYVRLKIDKLPTAQALLGTQAGSAVTDWRERLARSHRTRHISKA
ncbi:uncharacterized protein HMPREF1541_02284 [Cyphellophora europaea CBS 101466]|uniref:Uncharacterized protein n=1 Tax=Cyphellophora europaea (strain CBS 101466) TaxID=1220924 RepID=W2S336_CYPE1|nr:uncharacterized protein HMPREF1541_02284 [Cyphellophora europaea CBS 101466]ETN43126.1 hypothetical protein HMPREF1541_02284 [Cyphellophora europaea CBS 101466]